MLQCSDIVHQTTTAVLHITNTVLQGALCLQGCHHCSVKCNVTVPQCKCHNQCSLLNSANELLSGDIQLQSGKVHCGLSRVVIIAM